MKQHSPLWSEKKPEYCKHQNETYIVASQDSTKDGKQHELPKQIIPMKHHSLCIYLCHSQRHIPMNQRTDSEWFVCLGNQPINIIRPRTFLNTQVEHHLLSKYPKVPKQFLPLLKFSRFCWMHPGDLFRCMRKMSFCNMKELATWVAWRKGGWML